MKTRDFMQSLVNDQEFYRKMIKRIPAGKHTKADAWDSLAQAAETVGCICTGNQLRNDYECLWLIHSIQMMLFRRRLFNDIRKVSLEKQNCKQMTKGRGE